MSTDTTEQAPAQPPSKKPPKVVVPVRMGASGKAMVQAIAADKGEQYTGWMRDAIEEKVRRELAAMPAAKRARLLAARDEFLAGEK